MYKIIFIIVLFFSKFTYGDSEKVESTLDIDIAWGGYYVGVTNDNEISIFRLLDFNRDAYHAALYSEKFESIPSYDEVKHLSPFVGHAPINAKALLNDKHIIFLGSKPLAEDDLVGYQYYLEQHGVSSVEIEKLTSSLISYSKEPPLHLQLSIKNGNLEITQKNK